MAHGCGNMTPEEYMDIEESSYGNGSFTKKEIAEMGPEMRKVVRELKSNPYFPKPDSSILDESLYDGYKIKNDEVF